jgi:hypothetical protein
MLEVVKYMSCAADFVLFDYQANRWPNSSIFEGRVDSRRGMHSCMASGKQHLVH